MPLPIVSSLKYSYCAITFTVVLYVFPVTESFADTVAVPGAMPSRFPFFETLTTFVFDDFHVILLISEVLYLKTGSSVNDCPALTVYVEFREIDSFLEFFRFFTRV